MQLTCQTSCNQGMLVANRLSLRSNRKLLMTASANIFGADLSTPILALVDKGANLVMIVSCAVILGGMIILARRRRDRRISWTLTIIAAAVLLASLAHGVDITLFGHESSAAETGIVTFGGIFAIAAVFAVWRAFPQLIDMPRHGDFERGVVKTEALERLNASLVLEIDDRERDKAATYRETSHLRSIVDYVADGIATVDDSLNVSSWNRAAERIFSYDASAIVGKSLNTVIKGWPEAGTNVPREVIGYRPDGSTFPVEMTVGEFRVRGKRHYTAVFRDITDRKLQDDALRTAKDAADEASQAKSRFLANMSHEIRTPLGALLGFSELLINPDQPEHERAECISAIRRNGDLLSNIINDILDLSKVEAGKVQVEMQSVSVEDVITDISSLLGLQAQEKGIVLSVRYDGPMPPRIRTDALRLRQILVNIVGNAIKFTSRGEVEVTIKHTRRGRGRPQLAFAVRDTGPGISEVVAARLFNPFAQGDSSRTRMSGGTGLGLVLARRLAQLLGGDVELTQSTPDHGSTFTITVDPGEAEHGEQPIETPNVAPQGVISGRLDGIRILLVDDSPDNQMLITKFLTMAGALVEVANNGREGVQKTSTDMFDLIVMDIQMPVMDGYEAIGHLRRSGYTRPVIALTAHALKEEQQRCLACGFDGHLSKPINRQFLIEKLQGYAAGLPLVGERGSEVLTQAHPN